MDKRYQVFVSSTYADLKDERQHVLQALMEMDCIPAGMELFPAADEEQWAFIKSVIDDCDYYLLIIGGRYGSTTADGISYTEKEYEYAVEIGLKVIALLHKNPEDIPLGKSEIDPELRARLQAFRESVAENRLVKFWSTASELPGLVALSLAKTIKTHPAIGWVRANRSSSEDVLTELNEVRKENAALQSKLAELKTEPLSVPDGLAGLDESIKLHGSCYIGGRKTSWSVEATWYQIFAYISPYLVKHPNSGVVKSTLATALHKQSDRGGSSVNLDDQDFQTVSVQLTALGLVKMRYSKSTGGGMGLFWTITPKGERLMIELRAIKSKVGS